MSSSLFGYLSIVEKKLHKVVPDAVDIIVTPTLSLIAIGLIEIFFIMPLAGFISDEHGRWDQLGTWRWWRFAASF